MKFKVQLEISLTPAYNNQTITEIDDFVGIASIVSAAATLIHPAYAVLAIGAKVYETVRNYQKMSDKVERGAATNFDANLNLTGDILSVTSSVFTLGAYMTVPKGGELSFNTHVSIQTINGAATLVNGTKFILTTYDIFTRYFMDGDKLEFKDMITFGSSLILLTHSVNNMVIISQIGKVGGNTLRSILQSKIKTGLNLISGELLKCADQDSLRLLNDIPNKDDLNNIHITYKNLMHYSGFLAKISSLGGFTINILPGLLAKVTDNEIVELDFIELTKYYGQKFVKHIADSHNFIDVLNSMGKYFSEAIVEFVFDQARTFIEIAVDDIDTAQGTFVTTESIVYKMFSFIIKNYKDYTYEYLDMKRDEIMLEIRKYFQSSNPNTDEIPRNICDICGGYYRLAMI